ncbi:MAG: hypothetical protein RL634_1837 [Bacteroidota bacterium]
MKFRSIILIAFVFTHMSTTSAQAINLVLGRPTDTSITFSLMLDKNASFYFQLGTAPKNYTISTVNYTVNAGQPTEIEVSGLASNTQYFYRLAYKTTDATSISYSDEYSFYTQRARNNIFSFAVEADPHLDTNTTPESYTLSLKHMLSKKVDFLVDLGDNTMNDKLPVINDSTIKDRNILFRKYFSDLTHSASLFVVMGNHEGELGWLANTSLSNLPTTAVNLRKTYYPNPFPNGFYSGNKIQTAGVGFRENYYAWEWGNALFVVIDPYFYTQSKPGWGWTLGQDQYNWLEATLKGSTAKFKFVFSHQLVGGSGTDGRGGTEFAHLYEMGGYNDDSTYGFTKYRPGWSMPIHKLFVQYKVNIFFHGHDHCYVRQVKDGVIYQEVPQPSAKNINTITGTAYGYKEGVFLPSRGYMLVTVGVDSANIDYVRTYLPSEENSNRKNGDVAYSYSVKTGLLTSVRELAKIELVKILPNPAKSMIRVETAQKFNTFSYRLIDYTGRLYQTGSTYQINLSGLNPGHYLLQMKCDNFYVNKKIVLTNLP